MRFPFPGVAKLRSKDVENLGHVVEIMTTGIEPEIVISAGVLLPARLDSP